MALRDLSEARTGIHPLLESSNLGKAFFIVIGLSLILGVGTGYMLANKSTVSSSKKAPVSNQAVQTAQQDTKTFRDFAEGTIKPRPAPKNPEEYVEGTHFLERTGATPIALTSSVVDLSKYEGKRVKVFGETQKALKEGWLMDIGKVEEQ